MSVTLRLKRVGMKKQAYYRLVAMDRRTARDGKELEVLGHYDPKDKENKVTFKGERIQYWLSCGAQISDTVRTLLSRNGFIQKKKTEKAEATPSS
jgi:small subunit ribosomal protein S16